MADKNKILKRTKLIFLVEFLVISAVLFVIGFLRLFGVIPFSANRLLAYNIITLIGGAYVYFDFFFSLLKKSRRAKTCFLDKILSLIIATYLLVFDILVLSKVVVDQDFIKYFVSAVLLYAACMSLFMGIYHHFKPTQQVLDAVEEQYQAYLQAEREEQEKQKQSEESKETDNQ